MNTCIVTVYNSENCGSFLQAFALAKVLEKQGHHVSFLYRSTIGTSHDFTNYLVSCIKLLLRGRFKRLKNRVITYHRFRRAVQKLSVIKMNSIEYKNQDFMVIGSDTLWNFDDVYFLKHKDLYSGYLFLKKKAISYASSMSNTKAETILNDKLICDGIAHLKAISARDDYTANTIKKIIGEKPCIVLDPTLLLSSEEYEIIEGKCKYNNYILIYSFREFTKEKINEIIKMKEMLNTIVISFGFYREWVDINTPFDPFDLLAYYKNARYIITDTYHGTLYSIIYKKTFVCFGQNKNKIRDILTTLKLTNRFVFDEEQIVDKLLVEINYENTYRYLEKARQESLRYLKANIGEG